MAAPKASRTSRKPMCCLSVGYVSLLLDADKGTQVLKLLSEAVQCNEDYQGRSYVYAVQGPPNLELKLVQPGDVRMPERRDSHLLTGD